MAAVLGHPFWWSDEQKLQFLVDVSDRSAPWAMQYGRLPCAVVIAGTVAQPAYTPFLSRHDSAPSRLPLKQSAVFFGGVLTHAM